MQCCWARSGDSDSEPDEAHNESRGLFDLWRPKATGSGPRSPRLIAAEDENDDEQERKSAETVQRHTEVLTGEPNLLVYMVSKPPEVKKARISNSSSSKQRSQPKQRAYHIPPNTLEGVPIETELFVGQVIVMYKPAGGLDREERAAHPYDAYFRNHKRRWEFRVQGRFKRAPTGDMCMGIVLKDFNYNQSVAGYSMVVKKAAMSLVKYDLYFSWGDRCEAATKKDAELTHLVTNMTAWDQIIVTANGKSPPPLMVELTGLGDVYGVNLQRKEMGLEEYGKAVNHLFSNINTNDTYTLCFFGVSQVIDLLKWKLTIGTTVSMARFFEDMPLHVVMYEIDKGNDKDKSERQLEPMKRYYLDFMFWSNSVSCPALPARYIFKDAEEKLERFSAAHCSAIGRCESFHSCPSVERDSSPASSGWLASWTQKLLWVPASTCDGCRPSGATDMPGPD